ncbi:MAG: hypothetical protein KDN22_14115 [Verrucomicrobiae bacterium]|nr:hypothetical protein [Verrucomicrobiae bacterium]
MKLRSGVAAPILAAVTVITAPAQDAGSPEPIAVNILPVALALDDGSEAVVVSAHFDLEEVTRIWAGAGIALSFLAPLQLNSSELYDLTLAERDAVMQRKPDKIKALLDTMPPSTIVAIFVNELADSCSCQRYNGWGNIPGTLLIVDTNGPADPATGAAVLAHELGHNLSLKHTAIDGNLMNSEVAPWTVTLSPSQIADARKTAEALAAGTLVSRPRTEHVPKRDTIPGNYEMWFNDGQFFVRFRNLIPAHKYAVDQSADMLFWHPTASFTAEADEHLWIHTPPEQSSSLYYRLEDKGGGDGNEPETQDESPKVITKPR